MTEAVLIIVAGVAIIVGPLVWCANFKTRRPRYIIENRFNNACIVVAVVAVFMLGRISA